MSRFVIPRARGLFEPLLWSFLVVGFAVWAQGHPPNNFGVFGQPRANLLAPLIVGGGLNVAAAWAAGRVISIDGAPRPALKLGLLALVTALCAGLQFAGQALIVAGLEPDVSLRPTWQIGVNLITALVFVVMGVVYRLAREGLTRRTQAKDLIAEAERLRQALQKNDAAMVSLGAGRSAIRLPVADILYLRAAGNYFEVHTREKSHLVYGQLTTALNALAAERFVRTHRSYAVALSAVRRVSGRRLDLDGASVPIGAAYRPAVEAAWGAMR